MLKNIIGIKFKKKESEGICMEAKTVEYLNDNVTDTKEHWLGAVTEALKSDSELRRRFKVTERDGEPILSIDSSILKIKEFTMDDVRDWVNDMRDNEKPNEYGQKSYEGRTDDDMAVVFMQSIVLCEILS